MTLPNVVFLLDVDNTLLDNDQVQLDLRNHLESEFGVENRDRYWTIFDWLRAELGYADYLGALQRYRLGDMHDPRLLLMSSFLVDYPFAKCLYPGALEVIKHLSTYGPTVILSDGDVVFQPRKVQRSGLWEAVDGRVLIYIHKEQMLDDVVRRYPATNAGRCRTPLSGQTLRDGGRQAAHSGGNERCPGEPADDCLSAPGTLRAGSKERHCLSAG